MICRAHTGISFDMGYAFFVAVLFIAALMIPFSREAAAGAAEGLRLFASGVLPSLFPFFVCSEFIVSSGIFRKVIRGSKPVVFPLLALLTAICGTPSAALVCREMHDMGFCERKEASFLCAALNQTGPMFIISAVSAGFLKDISYSVYFAASHYLPSFAAAAILSLVYRRRAHAPCLVPASGSVSPLYLFIGSVSNAVTNILRAGGIVVFFRVLHSVAAAFGAGKLPGTVFGLLTGCAEMTNGVQLLCAEGTATAKVLCAFLISFGGVCIFVQTSMLFPELDPGSYFFIKFALGVASALLFYMLIRFHAPSVTVFGNMSEHGFTVRLGQAKARSAAVVCFALASGLTLSVSAILSRISRRI